MELEQKRSNAAFQHSIGDLEEVEARFKEIL